MSDWDAIKAEAYEEGIAHERAALVKQVEGLIEKARNGKGSWEWIGTTTTAYRDVLALLQGEPTDEFGPVDITDLEPDKIEPQSV